MSTLVRNKIIFMLYICLQAANPCKLWGEKNISWKVFCLNISYRLGVSIKDLGKKQMSI
jgi:hypothetical protein